MKNNNTKVGTYFIGEESHNFNFETNLSTVDKMSFINSVVDTLVDDEHYNSVMREMIFDIMLIRFMTDINTKDFSLEQIEEFLTETNIVDVIKVNVEDGLIDELNKNVDLGIEYKTGIHTNPLGEAFASLVNTLEKKVNEIDLKSAMGMATKFLGMTEELTPESVVNAYINSDMHKDNLEEIAKSKEQKEMLAKGLAKVVDIAVEKAKEEIKQED